MFVIFVYDSWKFVIETPERDISGKFNGIET
jgi:hypothetical protein